MNFYEVWIASQKYHGNTPLTYCSDEKYQIGDVVEVPLKTQTVSAIIAKHTQQVPSFKSKQIKRAIGVNIGAGIDLLLWILRYYPGPSGIICSMFVPQNFPQKLPDTAAQPRTSLQKPSSPLTQEQKAAVDKISCLELPKTVLLHGETGTGKTRVYIELAQKALQSGRSAIVLTPEIGLTPQLVAMFEEVFKGSVFTLHSKMTTAKRRDKWIAIANSKQPVIVIGPRSALFAPVNNLGLVVVDEAHDNSYKQDQTPHYQATRIAAKLASIHKALCVLGSATPSVSDYYSLRKNTSPIIRMTESVHTTKKPKITVVDKRDKSSFGRSWLFSEALIEGIDKAISNKQQSLVFLNRRGTARVVACEDCGWEALCPNCDITLTYHKDEHVICCHICNHRQPAPSSCPTCNSSSLLFKGAGSKALWDELSRLFPQARIKRFDSDNKPADTLSQYYQAIKSGEVDILVGTQILAKGLDIPNLTFVGIPHADSSLYLPDFTADEQTYQLLTQVAGRAGRRNLPSQVVIQTYSPDNPVIKSALAKDWDTFYSSQLKERRQFLLPPFCYLLKLKYGKKQSTAAERAAQVLATKLSSNKNLTVLGPTPAFYGRTNGFYQWQIVVKATKRETLLGVIGVLPSGWRHDIDPTNLL